MSNRKKVVIAGRFLSRRPTGVDRFGREILKAIDRLVERSDPAVGGLAFEVIAPRGTVSEFKNIPLRQVGRSQGQAWEQFELPRAVSRGDLLLSLCNTAPMAMRRQVVVIHDAATDAIPQSYSRTFRAWYRLLMPALGRRSATVLTVSEFSRKELARAFGVAPQKVRVVKEGGEHVLGVEPDASVLAENKIVRPFVLAVSSMAVHKNFRLVLDAIGQFEDLPFDVVIAGGANARVFGSDGVVGSNAGVKWVGYVSDAQLRALYEHAMCFVFPSLYEGFGIPPLEAMQCGCPVVVSNAASIPEVCGDAALYFDPHDASELAKILGRVAGDGALRDRLRASGRARASAFSWELGARQVLEACREAMERQT